MGPGLTTAGLQSEASARGLPRSASPPALLPSIEGRQTGSCMTVCSVSRGASDWPAAVQLAGRVAGPAGQGWVNSVSADHPRLRQALARSPQLDFPPICTSKPELLHNHFLSPHTSDRSQIVGGWGLVGTADASAANDNPGAAGISAPVLGIACTQERRIANSRSSAGGRHGTRTGCRCRCLSRTPHTVLHCAVLRCVVLTLDLRVVPKAQDEGVERQRPPKARRPGACGQEGGQAGGPVWHGG